MLLRARDHFFTIFIVLLWMHLLDRNANNEEKEKEREKKRDFGDFVVLFNLYVNNNSGSFCSN